MLNDYNLNLVDYGFYIRMITNILKITLLGFVKKIMNLAIIPARIGSKRIKNKNIIKVNNKPIIYYVIKKLIKCKIFDKIIVSTDSSKIIDISNRYGAQTPFLRPKIYLMIILEQVVVKHAIYWYKKKYSF